MSRSEERTMGEATTVRVRINGKDRDVDAGLTVRSLIESLELHPSLVVVELNREILARDSYGETPVQAGDSLELVHFVGGG
jgi:thiamine biosynthesis protein ThiS